MLKYFKFSFLLSGLGFIGAVFVGQYYGHSWRAGFEALFLVFILSILEVSISFDNAVVNATVLKKMTPLWQRRFLTWGILVAVFGMRLVFPLLLVGILAKVGPIAAIQMATFQPEEYAAMMRSVHHEVSAFGGAFLLLVALKYFFNYEKDVHWISLIERPLAKMGKLDAVEVGIALLTILILSRWVEVDHQSSVLTAGIAGVLIYIAVEAIGTFLEESGEPGVARDVEKASMGLFLYLEVLDASFSFDGVVGAFAITNNLFLIVIGLGIGALFVRSLTIYMVDKGTLDEFRYLEHGAFYAVWALATIMLLNMKFEIPEVITGLVGGIFIGLSIWSSVIFRRSARS